MFFPQFSMSLLPIVQFQIPLLVMTISFFKFPRLPCRQGEIIAFPGNGIPNILGQYQFLDKGQLVDFILKSLDIHGALLDDEQLHWQVIVISKKYRSGGKPRGHGLMKAPGHVPAADAQKFTR